MIDVNVRDCDELSIDVLAARASVGHLDHHVVKSLHCSLRLKIKEGSM